MSKGTETTAAIRAKKRKRTKERLLIALAESKGIVSYACEAVKITRKTFYEWVKEDAEFAEKVEEITESTLDKVEGKLLEAINDDNLTAIIFYLKTKGRKRGYVEQFDANINANPFEKLMKELPDEEE